DVRAIFVLKKQAPGAAQWTGDEKNQVVSSGVVLVAEEAGQLFGFVFEQAGADDREIENVVVAAAFLRRGIANELMRALIPCAKNEAAPAILLEVRESNLAARGLYE